MKRTILAAIVIAVLLVRIPVAMANHSLWHTPWSVYTKVIETSTWGSDTKIHKVRKDGYACFVVTGGSEGGEGDASIWCDPYSSPYYRRSNG